MTTYVLRVWVPDRPGALGAVASRIGAVRGDLVGIDILERGAGRAIDELLVELPDDDLVPLLIAEVSQVDGVDVEDVRPAPDWPADPRLDALETAAVLVGQQPSARCSTPWRSTSSSDFQADWAAVVDLDAPAPLVSVGAAPPAPWLGAFVAGSRASVLATVGAAAAPTTWPGPSWSPPSWSCVLGRRGRPVPGPRAAPAGRGGPDRQRPLDGAGHPIIPPGPSEHATPVRTARAHRGRSSGLQRPGPLTARCHCR